LIGMDHNGNRCVLRRWPLAHHGSPLFDMPLQQLQGRARNRPLAATKAEEASRLSPRPAQCAC